MGIVLISPPEILGKIKKKKKGRKGAVSPIFGVGSDVMFSLNGTHMDKQRAQTWCGGGGPRPPLLCSPKTKKKKEKKKERHSIMLHFTVLLQDQSALTRATQKPVYMRLNKAQACYISFDASIPPLNTSNVVPFTFFLFANTLMNDRIILMI